MDAINDRLDNLENVITNLVQSFKKIEDVTSKKDLYSFSTKQLIKWLKENEVTFEERVKDTLVDLIWENINEWKDYDWEWEYYDDEEASEEEADEEADEESQSSEIIKPKKNKKKTDSDSEMSDSIEKPKKIKKKVIESSDSDSFSDEGNEGKGKKKKAVV